jgi:hypothetical protein
LDLQDLLVQLVKRGLQDCAVQLAIQVQLVQPDLLEHKDQPVQPDLHLLSLGQPDRQALLVWLDFKVQQVQLAQLELAQLVLRVQLVQ